MKILYLTPRTNSYLSKWQNFHFIDELKKLGINFTVFEIPKENISNFSYDKLIKKFQKKDFNLLLSALDDSYISKDTELLIKDLSVPKVLICMDNLSVPFKHKKSCKFYDLVWLTSYETEETFKKWGANTIFLPFAANPYFFKPIKNKRIPGVTFIGTPYGTRMNKISFLSKSNISVNTYSSNEVIKNNPIRNAFRNVGSSINSAFELSKFSIGRKALYAALKKSILKTEPQNFDNVKFFPSVTFEDMSSIYSNSDLCLGISELWNTYVLKKPVHKLHLRTFEIPMSGGVQICSYTEELASYFENRKEILMYSCNEELKDLALFYLNKNNSNELNKIKLNARKRSIAEHTWSKRFQKIFDRVG